jgi:hypothetical protein
MQERQPILDLFRFFVFVFVQPLTGLLVGQKTRVAIAVVSGGARAVGVVLGLLAQAFER